MADVLISPLGRSPGAVSGVYFALKTQLGVEIEQVVTIGTSHIDVKSAASNYLTPLFSRVGVKYDPIHILPIDLRGRRDVIPFVVMTELSIKNALEAGNRVHMAITGGRSGVGALATLAVNLYGADRLWHLWVRQDIEEGGAVDKLYGTTDAAAMVSSPFLNPTVEDGASTLVELPFLNLGSLHDVLWDLRHAGEGLNLDAPITRLFVNASVEGLAIATHITEMEESAHLHLVELWQKLNRHFNREEMRSLCFLLNVEYDDLPGEGREDKARELVRYLNRRGHVSDLVQRCSELRPHIVWDKASSSSMIAFEDGMGTIRLKDVFPAGVTFAQADNILALKERFTQIPQDGFEVIAELGLGLQEAGVVDEAERQELVDMVGGQPEDLFKFAQRVQRDRTGFWGWINRRKGEPNSAMSAASGATSLLGTLLNVLESYLKDNKYIL